MNPFTTALAAGYTGVQVLEYLARSNPKIAKLVEQSVKSGYSLDQVADQLSKEFEGKANTRKKAAIEGEVRGTPTAHQKSLAHDLRTKREERLAKLVAGTALAAGGTAAARAMLASRGASGVPQLTAQNPPGSMPLPGAGGGPMGGSPMPRGGPGPMTPSAGGLPTNGILQAYMNHIMQGGKADLSSFLKTSMGVMAGQGMSQPAAAPTPQAPIDVTGEVQVSTPGQPPQPQPGQPPTTNNLPKSTELVGEGLSKAALQPQDAERVIAGMGIKDRVDALLNAGNDAELAGKIAEVQLTPQQKVLAKEQGLDIPSLVKSYAAGRQKPPEAPIMPQPQGMPPIEAMAPIEQQLEQEAQPIELPGELEDGATVTLPNGDIGKVTAIDGDRVTLDVDGQKKRAPLSHIMQPTGQAARFTDEEADYAMDRYIETQSLAEKSAPLLYVDYTPSLNMMAVRWTTAPEIGGYYTNVSPETAQIIRDRVTENKTSGRSGEGVVWEAGKVGIMGAAVNKWVKQVLDESGAVFHPYHKGDVIFDRHQGVNEKIAFANTGKTRPERDATRARTAARLAEKERKEKDAQEKAKAKKKAQEEKERERKKRR